jgi:hypothetical protein
MTLKFLLLITQNIIMSLEKHINRIKIGKTIGKRLVRNLSNNLTSVTSYILRNTIYQPLPTNSLLSSDTKPLWLGKNQIYGMQNTRSETAQ